MNKDKNSYVSTRTKTIFLVILSSTLFILLFLSVLYYTIKQENEFYNVAQKQYANEINSLLVLNDESKISNVVDVTFWDDFVNFTKTKDKVWFDENISVSLNNYKSDYLGVYGLDGKLIAKESNSKIKLADFVPKESMRQLYQSKFIKFFIRTTDGVVQVVGATIHPSNDPMKKKYEPSGYFFMASVLDQDYFKKLEKISSSKIYIGKENAGSENKEFIYVDKHLINYQNKEVAHLVFERPFNVNFKSTKIILLIINIAFIINLLFNLYFSRKWIFAPLKLITRILETKNKVAILKLKEASGEFAYIGNLFDENLFQSRQLEKAKSKAEESDRLKTAFLTNLSHEIRTPMNAIVGFSDLLENEKLEELEKLEYLNIIKQSGKNLVSIIDDLVEMSKIDSNQIAPNYTSINIKECLKELYQAIKITIPKEKNIDFRLINEENLVNQAILTDEIKVKQIIINLITNAIKFTHQGFISFGFKMDLENKTITFSVQDTGIGIEAEQQAVVFDRFRRIDGDYSIKVGGLGLGLAISKAYVEMLGGTISIQSKVNVGSTFAFTIPLILDESQKGTNKENLVDTNAQHTANASILVAEDDNINFLLIEKILQLKKHNIIRAKNGLEAVEICATNNNIDLVLMDIKMPELSGYEAIERIKKVKPALPIIAQTAYSSVEEKEKIKAAGFTSYITKPINKEALFDAIAAVLK
jgi:signal transduction histidine kinase/CheY-like chemotaxis protein